MRERRKQPRSLLRRTTSRSAGRHSCSTTQGATLGGSLRWRRLTTLNEAFAGRGPAVGEAPEPPSRSRRRGTVRGTELSATPARDHVAAPNPGVPSGVHAECISWLQSPRKVPMCRHFSCRRRDSNPRHADYDSAALWLYSAACGGWGTQRGHNRIGPGARLGQRCGVVSARVVRSCAALPA
jgi:hypothetical protein